MRLAVYPGSFDPVTNGHIDILEKTSKIFDRIIVAVVHNVSKKAVQYQTRCLPEFIRNASKMVNLSSLLDCFCYLHGCTNTVSITNDIVQILFVFGICKLHKRYA